MSSCSRRRWGPGTNCTRPADGNTFKTKEMDDTLAKMMAERSRQDAKWQAGTETEAFTVDSPLHSSSKNLPIKQ